MAFKVIEFEEMRWDFRNLEIFPLNVGVVK